MWRVDKGTACLGSRHTPRHTPRHNPKQTAQAAQDCTNNMASPPPTAGSTSGPPSPATRVPTERSAPARVAAEGSRRGAAEERGACPTSRHDGGMNGLSWSSCLVTLDSRFVTYPTTLSRVVRRIGTMIAWCAPVLPQADLCSLFVAIWRYCR